MLQLTDAESPLPGDPANGTSTSSSGCQTKHRALAAAPEPAAVGTDTSGRGSPAGFRGSLLLPPSPKSTPPGLDKKCLDPPLELAERQKASTMSFAAAQSHDFECIFAINCSAVTTSVLGVNVYFYILSVSCRFALKFISRYVLNLHEKKRRHICTYLHTTVSFSTDTR